MTGSGGTQVWQKAEPTRPPETPSFEKSTSVPRTKSRKPSDPKPPEINLAKIGTMIVSLGLLAVSGWLIFTQNPTALLPQVFCATLLGGGIGGFGASLNGDVTFTTKDGIVAVGSGAMFLIVLTLIFRALGLMPNEGSKSAMIDVLKGHAAYVAALAA